ncbi:MAG: sulfite exporter TauE/SafE family protein, partial [Cyanobacteria bacterium J06649_5]
MPSLLDLGFIAALGFLGSFGHCVGMCGPVAAAFALS